MNRSNNLNQSEHEWLEHMIRWGSDGYPVSKTQKGRGWIWHEAHGIKGAPVVYKTKREAMAACAFYENMLIDKTAGRFNP